MDAPDGLVRTASRRRRLEGITLDDLALLLLSVMMITLIQSRLDPVVDRDLAPPGHSVTDARPSQPGCVIAVTVGEDGGLEVTGSGAPATRVRCPALDSRCPAEEPGVLAEVIDAASQRCETPLVGLRVRPHWAAPAGVHVAVEAALGDVSARRTNVVVLPSAPAPPLPLDSGRRPMPNG